MTSIHVDLDSIEWTPGSAYKGPDALYQGQEVFYRKGLSDRRQEGGGLAVLSKICPPPWCLAEGYTLSGLLGGRFNTHIGSSAGWCYLHHPGWSEAFQRRAAYSPLRICEFAKGR